MATSTLKIPTGTLSLHTYNTYRDMMTIEAPSKKPVCQRYLRGECSGKCPFLHPKILPPQPAPPKTAPATTKQPWKATQNPTKPPTQPTPQTSTQIPPQQPKNDGKSVSTAVVPEEKKQKTPPEASRPAESQTPQGPVARIRAPWESWPSTVKPGPRARALASRPIVSTVPCVNNLKSFASTVSTRSQTTTSSTGANSAVIQVRAEPVPVQQIPSSPSTSGSSTSHKNFGREKKFENPTIETPPTPGSVSSERSSITESSRAQCDQKNSITSKRGICRKYLHKRCFQNPCPYYHDPALADVPPLCSMLYDGPCIRRPCEFYHPEGNRNREVCIRALRSQCDHDHCYRFHFQLPSGGEVAPVKREPQNLPVSNRVNSHPPSPPISKSPRSPLSTNESAADSRKTQCPAWNDGYCPEGARCKMLHIHRNVRWKMEAEQAAAKTIDRMIFDNTRVVFGAGCEIKEVTTALESCRVLISNLPPKTTREALEEFLTSAGFNRFHILILRLSIDRETQEASVIFNDARHAETVVEVLDKQKYFDEVLKFELAPVVTGNQMDDWTYNRSSYLEVTFNLPAMRVQAIYPSVEAAIEKAKTLNGGRCGGRIVHVTVARKPDPEKHEKWRYIKNSITISNVAPNTPDSVIKHFAEPFSMRTFAVRRFKVHMVLQTLEEHMQTIGGLKPGDFDYVQNNQRGTISARGRFDTWEQADKVYRWLRETELDLLDLAHAQFFLAFPHQYSLHVPLEHYDAQKEVYDGLEAQYGRDPTAHIVATRYSAVCLIQVVGVDKKAVGGLKLKVEKIARGEIIEVWDRFFLNWQGEAFFGRLLRQFEAYVRPDKTRQVLRVYGSETAVNRARREIKEQMKTLAALDFQMTIERDLVGFFIRNGMKILGDMLGEDNVWLHTTSKPYFVSVRGGHDAEHALRELVGEAKKRHLHPPTRDLSRTCPLCFEEPTQPFPLACCHVYCTGCLKHTLNSAIDGRNIPICCIGNAGRCNAPIPLPVIERFISPALLTQMFENSFRVHLEKRPNEFRFCSTPDCTQIYRVSKEDSVVIQCPACLIETCSHCHKSPHRGYTCEENTLIGSKSGQELLLERWAKGNTNVKKCPDCGVFIEKIDGCNHIHCRCGGHVCWICAKTFNDGIYDHLNAVHGGAYDPDH